MNFGKAYGDTELFKYTSFEKIKLDFKYTFYGVSTMIVYGIYYVWILISLLFQSVYVSMPITIKIAGEEAGGYYYSFGKELWIGRLLLLTVAFLIYKLGENRFCNLIRTGNAEVL